MTSKETANQSKANKKYEGIMPKICQFFLNVDINVKYLFIALKITSFFL